VVKNHGYQLLFWIMQAPPYLKALGQIEECVNIIILKVANKNTGDRVYELEDNSPKPQSAYGRKIEFIDIFHISPSTALEVGRASHSATSRPSVLTQRPKIAQVPL